MAGLTYNALNIQPGPNIFLFLSIVAFLLTIGPLVPPEATHLFILSRFVFFVINETWLTAHAIPNRKYLFRSSISRIHHSRICENITSQSQGRSGGLANLFRFNSSVLSPETRPVNSEIQATKSRIVRCR